MEQPSLAAMIDVDITPKWISRDCNGDADRLSKLGRCSFTQICHQSVGGMGKTVDTFHFFFDSPKQ